MKRYVFADAVAELDGQDGCSCRHLLEHARIEKDVVVIGYRPCRNLGSGRLVVHLSAIEGSAGDVAERLADKRS
jgi:hypothetical protein